MLFMFICKICIGFTFICPWEHVCFRGLVDGVRLPLSDGTGTRPRAYLYDQSVSFNRLPEVTFSNSFLDIGQSGAIRLYQGFVLARLPTHRDAFEAHSLRDPIQAGPERRTTLLNAIGATSLPGHLCLCGLCRLTKQSAFRIFLC